MILNMFSQLFSAEKNAEPTTENLAYLLGKIKEEIDMTEDLFNLTDDDDLMETAVYKLKSLQIYYQYLLKQIRLAASIPTTTNLKEKEVVPN